MYGVMVIELQSFQSEYIVYVMNTNVKLCAGGYRLGKSPYSNIVVYYKYKFSNPQRNRFVMVDRIDEAWGANDEPVVRITGYQGAQRVVFDFSCEAAKVGTSSECDIVLRRGDLITVGDRDQNGLVGNIEVHYDILRNWSGTNQICPGGCYFDRPAYKDYDMIAYWVN